MARLLSKWFREAIPDGNKLIWFHNFSQELNVAICIYFIVKFTVKKIKKMKRYNDKTAGLFWGKHDVFMFLITVAPLMGFCVAQLSPVHYTTQFGMWALSMQFDRSYIFLLNGRSLQIHASQIMKDIRKYLQRLFYICIFILLVLLARLILVVTDLYFLLHPSIFPFYAVSL